MDDPIQPMRVRKTRVATAKAQGRLALLALLIVCGCQGASDAQNEGESEKIGQLTVLYSQYAAMNRGTGPADEASFKQFISRQPGGLDVEAMLVSGRDNQPYVVLYGKTLAMSFEQNAPPDVVIYEKEGVGGSRYLGAADGQVGLVDEEKFKELVPE